MDRSKDILLIKAKSKESALHEVDLFLENDFPGVFSVKHVDLHELPGEAWIRGVAFINGHELEAGVDEFIRQVHESGSADEKEIQILEACADAIYNSEFNGLVRFYNISDGNFMYPEDDNGWWAAEVEITSI